MIQILPIMSTNVTDGMSGTGNAKVDDLEQSVDIAKRLTFDTTSVSDIEGTAVDVDVDADADDTESDMSDELSEQGDTSEGTSGLSKAEDTVCDNKFRQLDVDPTYSAHEKSIQAYWESINIDRSMRERNEGLPKFVFTDGPPFVSGDLHYGHAAVMSYKDAMIRYMTMRGYDSSFTLGYDCHGLPIEKKVCGDHDLTEDQMRDMGLANFNELCDQTVTSVSDSWTPLLKRIARHADFDNTYMTRDRNFMESCIWVFKQLWDKGLVYCGNKVMPYSPALQTPLSNFEAGQNYQNVTTKSIYVLFDMKELPETLVEPAGERQAQMIVWTTTPWTLPSNLFLCVNANIDYVLVDNTDSESDSLYILSAAALANVFGKKRVKSLKIIAKFKGSDLAKCRYEPVMNYMTERNNIIRADNDNFFRVLTDNYVKDEGIGTGIVHQAPAFGEDDFRVCAATGFINNENVKFYCPIDDKCCFTSIVPDYDGMFVLDADDAIRFALSQQKKLYKIHEYDHNYPHCYRTDKPLIYRTVRSYFIRIEPLSHRMIELNRTVTWFPPEIGTNRFGTWLENSKDWAVSRFRSYGTPLPIWVADDGEEICVGSVTELKKLADLDNDINDLHPQHLNDITIKRDGKTFHRVPDIFDCWFESGCVPFGQIHYPFDAKKAAQLKERDYLCDFVCEGLDQTRGWFYTLLVISTAILDRAPFRNVICTGIVLDEKGDKLSKRLKNYEDPQVLFEKFGADIVRAYFLRSPLMRAEPLFFSTKDIAKFKTRFTPFINSFKFMIVHASNFMKSGKAMAIGSSDEDGRLWDRTAIDEYRENPEKMNLMDRWMICRMIELTQQVNDYCSNYRVGNAIDVLVESIEDLANWYVKLNRDRLKGSCSSTEQSHSLQTLYEVLIIYTHLWAPFMPFLSEYLFQRIKSISLSEQIRSAKSVFLSDMPDYSEFAPDHNTLDTMRDMQRICSMVRNMRDGSDNHTSVKAKIKKCTISHADPEHLARLEAAIPTIQAELNVVRFNFKSLVKGVKIGVKINNRAMGMRFRKDAKKVIAAIEGADENDLYKLYFGCVDDPSYEGELTIDVDGVSGASGASDADGQIIFKYPCDEFELYAMPLKADEGATNVRIDRDLMVHADLTYDADVNHDHQVRLLHSVIQNARKEMKLEPWNRITVMIDTIFVDATRIVSGNDTILKNLGSSVTNADFIVASFDENPYENGITETDRSRIYVGEFVWTTLDGEKMNGHYGVHYRLDG